MVFHRSAIVIEAVVSRKLRKVFKTLSGQFAGKTALTFVKPGHVILEKDFGWLTLGGR